MVPKWFREVSTPLLVTSDVFTMFSNSFFAEIGEFVYDFPHEQDLYDATGRRITKSEISLVSGLVLA